VIYKIEIENFYSIRDCQTLDLRVPANAPADTLRLASCWRGSAERAPKVVAVFGANGSGKSNLLRALSFAARFVGSSFALPPGEDIGYIPFNDEAWLGKPTRLKFWFSGLENLDALGQDDAAECPYCYELTIANGDCQRVVGESIFFWPAATGRKTRLIERFEDGSVKASRTFGLAGYKSVLGKILRPNASMISTLAQLNHPIAASITQSAQQVQSNISIEKFELPDDFILSIYADSPDMVARFNREISRIDTGVRGIEIHANKHGLHLLFQHEELSSPIPLIFESHGTRQFLKLFPQISIALETGGVVIIDELDAAIHSMILPEIVSWFHDSVRNPHNAQLWISCHNVSLLEDLSKDEIVFCEKDRRGRTEIYSLNDIKGVRRDDNYYRKYLGGVFGAVPRIG